KRQKTLLELGWQSSKAQTNLKQAEITRLVKHVYLQLQYVQMKQQLLQKTDSIFSKFQKVAKLRFEKGETNLLEKATLDNQVQQLQMQMQMLLADKQNASLQLGVLLNTEGMFDATDSLTYTTDLFDSSSLSQHPILNYYKQQQQLASGETQLEKARLSPDWMMGYSNQSIVGFQKNKDATESYYDGGKRFSTVQLGIAVPVFNKAQKAKINAAHQKESIAAASTEIAEQNLKLQLQKNWNEYVKYQQAIEYYKSSALPQAEIIIQTANLKYKNGQINYIEWGSLISNAVNLQTEYADVLREFNIRKIELEYLLQPNKN
ncbi:MAG TPA: TolC family protein, partial [Panacibacter sp.]|nr:TolC family protein [Panacibacter sp.]